MTDPATPHPKPLTQLIARQARDLGFALVGICPATPAKHPQTLKNWISTNQHGEMKYLADHLNVRLDPQNLLHSAQSIICLADAYPPSSPYSSHQAGKTDPKTAHSAAFPSSQVPPVGSNDRPPNMRGKIARYAWGRDYHKTIKKRLFQIADQLRTAYPDAQFKCTTDTAPLLEREYAAAAGLGWTGKHTLLIHPKLGSYLLLGAIVTSLDLSKSDPSQNSQVSSPDPPFSNMPMQDHCGSCTRCIDACPTKCIDPDGYKMDGSRCISYLTLEHRSTIPLDLQPQMQDWIAGCDICQEVCPHNRPDNHLPLDQFLEAYKPNSELAAGLDLFEILDWSPEDRQRVFQGSALKRIKLDMFKRNALIALGNQLLNHPSQKNDQPELIAKIKLLAEDESESELVSETARQTLNRLISD
ncbi:epoxyqueuosine reductase [Poriferisphaera sp. WC338]|uniref:epoxyqueuosine reductase n=1 Tax=Poriferisphaera sp. WC338 TaxID=3425129 RepID=UPI003D814C09